MIDRMMISKYLRRKSHCVEILNRFLCRGDINVPQDVFIVIEDEMINHGVNKETITLVFIENILKKHGMSRYCKQVMYILCKITGTYPQLITQEQYELVLTMFDQVNKVYEKCKPLNRCGFLKYTFVLNKIFLIIGLEHQAEYFKSMKSKDKLSQCEEIWDKICNALGWKTQNN